MAAMMIANKIRKKSTSSRKKLGTATKKRVHAKKKIYTKAVSNYQKYVKGAIAGKRRKNPMKSHSKTKHHRRYRRRNPIGGGKIDFAKYAINIGMSAGGALGINALMGLLPLPESVNKFKPLVSFAVAFGVGFMLQKTKMKNLGMQLIEGVGTIEAYNFGRQMINQIKPGLLSANDDDLESLLGEAQALIGRDSGLIGAYEKVPYGSSIQRMQTSSDANNVASMAEVKKKQQVMMGNYNYDY